MMTLTRRMMDAAEPLTLAGIRALAAELIGREPRSLAQDAAQPQPEAFERDCQSPGVPSEDIH